MVDHDELAIQDGRLCIHLFDQRRSKVVMAGQLVFLPGKAVKPGRLGVDLGPNESVGCFLRESGSLLAWVVLDATSGSS